MPAEPGNNPEYRRAWSRFATGVTVITTVEPDGTPHGMTANAITSVALEPPLALVCISHARTTFRIITESNKFGISLLGADQRAAAEYFARRPDDRVGDQPCDYKPLNGGHPVIEGALSMFECTVISAHEAGDHTIFVGRVEAFETRDGEPLMWFESAFGGLQYD